MLSNRASGGRFGVLISGAVGGTVAANALHDNCVGALLFFEAAEYRLAANRVNRNTRVCPAVPDEWPALSGSGVTVFAASSNTIVANLITGNLPAGDTEISGGVVVTGEPGFPSADNVVKGNVILRNDPDIFWDLGGRETCSETTSVGRASHRTCAAEPSPNRLAAQAPGEREGLLVRC